MSDPRESAFSTTFVRRFDDAPAGVLRWTLDAPAHERAVDLSAGMLYVQGWLLLHAAPTQPPQVLVREAADDAAPVRRFPFSSGRPDVIERVLAESPNGHPQLRCGFSFRLPIPEQTLSIGFEFDGTVFWAADVTLRRGAQVLEGRDGWLFLTNDTNRSVDQFTGALRLDRPALARWQAYLDGCRALADEFSLRHVLVVAPSKEEVLREQYPFVRTQENVLDQVRGLVVAADHLVDAAPVLAASAQPELCFKRTDTHWTDRGAMLAVLAVLAEGGFDRAAAENLLRADTYKQEPYVGDLGVKLTPARSAPTEFLVGPPSEGGAHFDNRLPNIGRVLIFETAQPCFDRSLLMFGASSGYPMLKYLKRLFRRVVFVHSAAQVDIGLVAHERPDLLLLQSNGRFVIEPPHLHFRTRDAVGTKLAEASAAVRAHVAALVAQAPAGGPDAPYYAMLTVD